MLISTKHNVSKNLRTRRVIRSSLPAPRFGKSLFLSSLMYYYDINEAENFDQIFGNLYIGKHPSKERNSYAVLKFDFRGLIPPTIKVSTACYI
ncbi:MAG: AAA family ATPase [Prevotellaceae bacterium]|nr:AAA family ATPase [Prevotellaceae bacterium]